MATDRSYTETLALLKSKGVRFSTVFDLGCADGHFFVEHFIHDLLPGAIPVNIDANPLYEPSLQAVQDAAGGHYRIAAVAEEPGEIAFTTSIHPYWSSLRPSTDPYWDRLNQLSSGVQIVPAIRLDDLVEELGLKPPYLLKLDIQGAEVQALRSARNILKDTNVVIVEADVDDFQAINSELVEAGFRLYDLTTLNYLADQSLGWFYPVYVHSRFDHLMETRIWNEAHNQQVIGLQVDRRKKILQRLAEVLPKLKAMRKPAGSP